MKLHRIAPLFCLAAAACSDDGPTYLINQDALPVSDTDGETGLSDVAENDVADDAGMEDTTTNDTAEDTGTADTEPDLEADVEPDTELDAEPDVERDAEPDAEPDTEPDVEPDAEPDTEPDVVPDVEPDVPTGPVCGEDWFSGQAFEDPEAPEWSADGGFRSETPYPASYDSGIADIVALAPFDADPTDAESPFPVDIISSVVEATVFATAPNTSSFIGAQRSFWIHDGVSAVQVFLDEFGDQWPPFDVHVGQHISFTATQVSSYRGVAQISGAVDWVLESSGNAVAFRDIENTPITFGDVPDNVRLTGTIVSSLGPCGGSSTCYDLEYGSQSVTFRTSADWIEVGDCIDWAGPVGTFGGAPQLDGANFRWFYDHGPE